MSQKRDRLNRLQIPKPCPVDWEEMTGNDQRRFCNQCNKNVYNLSTMTRQQAEAVVTASRGQLCARFTRLPDGSILTKEEPYPAPPMLHQINTRRATPIAAAVLSALVAVTPVITVQAQPSADHSATIAALTKPNRATAQDTAAKITGTITDPYGAVIPGATLTLINDSSNETRAGQSGEDGTYQFDNIAAGTYILKVESPGFKRGEVHGINVQARQQQTVNVALEPAATGMGGVVVTLPQPLRTLYKHSDRIVIATTGKSIKAEDKYGQSLYKTELHVTSTLKGEHKALIYLYHWVDKEELAEFAPGNRLLLFLGKYDSGKLKKDAYQVDDTAYGIKQLPDADLQVYKQRLAELAKITNAAKLNGQELVEWLVRCAENPATRFEGAYEFLRGAEQLANDNEDKADSDDKEQKTEAPTDELKGDGSYDSYKFLTAHLSQSQKDRLMNALFRTDQLGTRDAELIQLARIWKEPRLTPFLIAQLHSVQYDPTPYVPQMMQMLTEILDDDEELETLANEYEAIIKAQEDADEEEDDAGKKQPDKIEWKQQRSEIVKKFLAAVKQKLNKEEK